MRSRRGRRRLNTTVLPHISAGAIFHDGIANGKFHGVMTATTPNGRRTVYATVSRVSDGVVYPNIRRPSPAAYWMMFNERCTSARASGSDFPSSNVMETCELLAPLAHQLVRPIQHVRPLRRGRRRPTRSRLLRRSDGPLRILDPRRLHLRPTPPAGAPDSESDSCFPTSESTHSPPTCRLVFSMPKPLMDTFHQGGTLNFRCGFCFNSLPQSASSPRTISKTALILLRVLLRLPEPPAQPRLRQPPVQTPLPVRLVELPRHLREPDELARRHHVQLRHVVPRPEAQQIRLQPLNILQNLIEPLSILPSPLRNSQPAVA